MQGEQGQRTLSDADVDALAARLALMLPTDDKIAARVDALLADRIVRGAGSGALAVVKRLILWIVVWLAVYALAHGWKP